MISIGDEIDSKYLVLSRLGSGGFGEVFLAGDKLIPGRKVALKVLSNRSAGDHADLIWEMQTLSQFNHPGVVGFHHHFTHGGQLVLAMEYCAGGNLDQRISNRRVNQSEVFRWAAVLCEALDFVHGKAIVHHDIKPANILFATDGAIKLGDFGVANRNTGTRRYLPPEMLMGESVSKTDPRVDVYALGLTILEVLLGKHPFESLSEAEALNARIAHTFVPDTLPRWVQEVLLRATHPTPEFRFQRMAELSEAINSKHVPYVFDGNRIKAHALTEKAETLLTRKKWKSAEKLATQALHLSPDCVTALVAAGRCQLMIRRIDKAKDFFSKALSLNPRIHIQKELGWLNLEEGHLPIAISLLSDHLDRNASDFEAYNLMLKCFFLSGRYEAGMKLGLLMMKEKVPNDCFRNNRFLCYLLDGYTPEKLDEIAADTTVNPFTAHNIKVARESPRSWTQGGTPTLRSKLIFQEYRFGTALSAKKSNQISIRLPDGSSQSSSAPLVSIGLLAGNDIVLKDTSVSRRHAVIVNLPEDVWLCDLGSTRATKVANESVSGRRFLDGVHRVSIGDTTIEVTSRSDLLV
jgi:serine/threonine protein kinase